MSETIQEFERCVVGAVILDNDLMRDVSLLLTPLDFYTEAYRKIFLVLLNLHQTNRPLDIQLLMDELERRKETKACRGVFHNLTSDIPRHVGHYCRLVKEASQRRQIQTLLSRAQEQDGSPAEISGQLISKLSEFQKQPDFAGGEIFISSDRFCSTIPEEVDWLVEKLIPMGTNGIIAGVPKVSKSLLAADLAVSLATGDPFLGFVVTRPVKVALVSREDHPGLTGWRLRAFRNGRGFDTLPNLIVNTRNQTERMMLDDGALVAQLIEALKRHRAEFVIFDVFNRLHLQDENDSQQMAYVLAALTKIQTEVRCGIAVIHHYNKSKDGTWTERLRGSSAISGWVEWLMGITLDEAETKTRKIEFELKAAEAHDPVFYRVDSNKERKTAKILVVEDPAFTRQEQRRANRVENRLV